ncbi:MAG: hypothetical protein PHR56_00160 [Dehalococcoidales bacterium]|nr:hypothetical protein [Dehalococcoidales bacterium]
MTGSINKYWVKWTIACGAGELIGIGAAAGIWVLHSRFLGEPQTAGRRLLLIVIMMLAGIIEGSVTGAFQWAVLKIRFADIRARNWLFYTALGAAVAWLLGMLPSTFIPQDGGGMADIAGWQMILLSAALGIFLGALFGAAQWLELRKHTPDAIRWIPANLLAWMVGLAVIFAGAAIPGEETALFVTIIIGAVSGLLGGLSVGAVTGLFLIKLNPERG